jgi:hypothetical protein
MAEREDLKLECHMAPKGGEKCGQKGRQDIRKGNRRKEDNPQFINQIRF